MVIVRNRTFLNDGGGQFEDWSNSVAWEPADIAPDLHGAFVTTMGSSDPMGTHYINQTYVFPDFVTTEKVKVNCIDFTGVGIEVWFGTTVVGTITATGIHEFTGVAAGNDRLWLVAKNDTTATIEEIIVEPLIITEVKRIKVDSECKDNPIYLQWLNSSGGPSYWLFSRQNTQGITTAATGTYKAYEPDMEVALGGDEYTGKDVTPSIIIGANVAIEDMDGIKGLLMSGKVLMLMNPTTWTTDASGPVWQRVRVQPGSYIIKKANDTRRDIEMVLLLPEINIQVE